MVAKLVDYWELYLVARKAMSLVAEMVDNLVDSSEPVFAQGQNLKETVSKYMS